MLEHLWNGWRATYVQSVPEPVADDAPSVFTRILESGLSDSESQIIHRARTCFALLNAYPYAPGHLLIVPYREVADLEALNADEASELWRTVTEAVVALKTAYRPEGVNIGANLGRPAGGSVSAHLHIHVVPRWTGDSNFMTTIANTRTLPEALADTARRLRSAWPAPDTTL